MEQHNSCVNTKAVIEYVEDHDPQLVQPLLKSLEPFFPEVIDLRSFLTDPNNWVSTDVLIRMYQGVKRHFGRDDVVFDIGFESVAKRRLGYIQRIFLHAFGSHQLALKRLQSLQDNFNRNKTVELAVLGKEGAVVRLKWFGGIPLTRDFCLMNQGVYTAVPVTWDEPPCELEEKKCFFKGDDYCEYHIGWKRTRRARRLILQVVAPWRVARETIAELERDKELLKEKYAEVNGLNFQLKYQLDRLVGLQEASTAILSTLDFQELMTLILKRLVDVSAVDRAAIFLVNEEDKSLHMAHAVGAEEGILRQAKNYAVRLDKPANIIARVARTGEAEIVEDLEQSGINPQNPLIRQFEPRAFVALPLRVRGQVIGVLVGDQDNAERRSLAAEKEFLVSFSNQIAIAIHNANLYHKLEASERQYRELVENAHDGIWVVDENGLITFANQRLADMLGYDSMLGRKVHQLIPPGKKQVLVNLLIRNMRGAVAQEEISLVRREGGLISAIISSVPIFEGQEYKGGFAMVTDITEQKLMEKQLLHRQKMESIGTMAGGIAHDFNNILTAILGYSALLKFRLEDQKDLRRYVDVIETSSMRAADLVRQMLAFSRGTEHENLEAVDANKIIRETAKLLESSLGKNINLGLQLNSGLPPVKANSTQVQQALINLCLNARDAMPQGGEIVISTALVDLSGPGGGIYRGLVVEPDRYIRIQVADTGTGVPEEYLDKIFDPFFTTKEIGQGSGLGLAMVYGIVKNSRGYVHVESQTGKGSIFNLFFRLAEAEDESLAEKHLQPGLTGSETILLVDDEDLVLDLGGEILKRYGYSVLRASNGEEALQVYREEGKNIDLVILDLLMPKLDGAEALIQLKNLNPSVKVVICSGYGSEKKPFKDLLVSGTAMVSKPFQPDELVATVRKTLDNDKKNESG